MQLSDLFLREVERDIPPVVYFHDQEPKRLEDEVQEYIITGGWPESHPNHRRVPDGIHEQYVRLLTAIASELDNPGGPELPTAWISGFYGSGKSSFAKLLGLAMLVALMVVTSDMARRPGMPRAIGHTVAITSLLTAATAAVGVALSLSGRTTPLVGTCGDLLPSALARAQAGFPHPNLLRLSERSAKVTWPGEGIWPVAVEVAISTQGRCHQKALASKLWARK